MGTPIGMDQNIILNTNRNKHACYRNSNRKSYSIRNLLMVRCSLNLLLKRFIKELCQFVSVSESRNYKVNFAMLLTIKAVKNSGVQLNM
jgi:hypothetical protein